MRFEFSGGSQPEILCRGVRKLNRDRWSFDWLLSVWKLFRIYDVISTSHKFLNVFLNTYKICFCPITGQSTWIQVMPQEFTFCSNTLWVPHITIRPFSSHENIPFSSWCIACRNTGQPSTNVIPHECCSSHLGSSFELLARQLFETRQKMGTEGENCPALICCKNSDRRSFQCRSGRSKARLAESGHEGRWYRWSLISFTDGCEMTSSVVWTHTRHHYTLLCADPPFLPHYFLHASSYRPKTIALLS